MLLSLSASADASLIASLMQTGQPAVSIQTGREGITDWYNRLTDAAHRFQHAINGEQDHTWDVVSFGTATQSRWPRLILSPLIDCGESIPVSPPIEENLTNLPPPIA